MSNRRPSDKEFDRSTIEAAFGRQGGLCASCGTRIWKMGNDGALWHKFGERAEAHHVRPVKAGGSAAVENCVVVCRSCHYSAHQGGRWADVEIYRLAGAKKRYASVSTIAKEYPFYRGRRRSE